LDRLNRSDFFPFAIGIPLGAMWLKTLEVSRLPNCLLRILSLEALIQDIEEAPFDMLSRPRLVVMTILMHGKVFILGAATFESCCLCWGFTHPFS
jgi:hypothetical protein